MTKKFNVCNSKFNICEILTFSLKIVVKNVVNAPIKHYTKAMNRQITEGRYRE